MAKERLSQSPINDRLDPIKTISEFCLKYPEIGKILTLLTALDIIIPDPVPVADEALLIFAVAGFYLLKKFAENQKAK